MELTLKVGSYGLMEAPESMLLRRGQAARYDWPTRLRAGCLLVKQIEARRRRLIIFLGWNLWIVRGTKGERLFGLFPCMLPHLPGAFLLAIVSDKGRFFLSPHRI